MWLISVYDFAIFIQYNFNEILTHYQTFLIDIHAYVFSKWFFNRKRKYAQTMVRLDLEIIGGPDKKRFGHEPKSTIPRSKL